MNQDRDLKIAELALRGELISPDQFDRARAAWEADRTIAMGEILEARGFVDGFGRARLERLADDAAAGDDHRSGTRADDPAAARAAGDDGPDTAVAAMLAQVKDLDQYATLAAEPGDRTADDSSSGHIRLSNLDDSDSGHARSRYARTQLHAKGGIGQVWLARDGELGREVALKELRPEQGSSPDTWSRFVDEARITGQLEHPGIVPVYELSVHPEDGDPFYTMRFVRGKTLNQAVHAYHEKRDDGRAGPLDLASLLTTFVSLCNTVGYAHSRGVIHRDLKGQNVVLGDFGEVILLDWGIAKLVGPGQPTKGDPAAAGMVVSLGEGGAAHEGTAHGEVIGTPFYMAPEQAEGRVEEIDARTDIYGLGAILYEILGGKAPYEGYATGEVLRKVREGALPSPRLTNPEVSKALEAICLKAMAKRREDRYPTALVLAEEVRRWLADEPVSAYREPWTIRLARSARRHRTAVLAGAAVLIMAVVGLSVTSVLIGRERDEARRQRQQARQAVDDNYTRVAEEWLADRLDPLQLEFLQKALAYYRDFAAADAADPGLRREQGRAYLRMGDVLRKLGRHDEAEPAYRRSIAILGRLAVEAPAVAEVRDHLAEATYRLGSERATRNRAAGLDEAGQLFRTAAATQEARLAEAPATARRVALGRTLDALADLLRVTGRADEAEATYRRAIPLLERAAADEPGAVAARQELGVALDGLGFLLKGRGQGDEAMTTARRAVEAFEGLVALAPTLPAPRDGLAKAYDTLALLLRDAGAPAESAVVLDKEVALKRRLVEDYPARPEYRRTLARGLINRGIIDRETGRPAEADAAYSEALTLNEKLATEFPDDRKVARDQARCLNNLGELRATRKGEAEPLFRKALAIYQGLVAAAPGVPEHRSEEASVLQALGTWLYGNRRGDEAIETLKRAVDRFDALAIADAEDPVVRRGLAQSLNSLGAAYVAAGRRPEADEAYRRAVGAYDQLVARPSPQSADRVKLAAALSNRGGNQTKAKLPGAEDSLRRSLALYDELARQDRSAEFRFNFAVARDNLGDWLENNGQPEAAEVAYRGSIDLFGGLAGEFPKNLTYKTTLGQARAYLGGFLVARGRPDDGRLFLEQGIAEERAALAAAPQVRVALRGHLGTLAALNLDRRAYAEVAKLGEEMLRVAGNTPSARPEVARLLARCVPLAAADDQLTEARRVILSGAYADRAIALLREAIDGGGPEAGRLLREPDFDPIRNRDGFKVLEPEKVGRRQALDPPTLSRPA